MERPLINVDDIADEKLVILAVSSENDGENTYVHTLYTPNMEDEDNPIVQLIESNAPDAWLKMTSYKTMNDAPHGNVPRNMIILPNEYLSGFSKFQEHDVLIYLMHQFACVKDYNAQIDKELGDDADMDDYRENSYAYQQTLLHFGTERVLEYIKDSYDPLFEIPLRVLKIKAETSKYYEGNPDQETVDILTGGNAWKVDMTLII